MIYYSLHASVDWRIPLCKNDLPIFEQHTKMTNERKLIVYIAASTDGFIAKPNDDLSFLSIVNKEGEDYGYNGFIETVDTIIIGRKTYDWVMAHVPEYAHPDKTVYVVTRTPRESIGNLHFFTGNLKELVVRLKREEGKNIFIDGGAEIVHALLQ